MAVLWDGSVAGIGRYLPDAEDVHDAVSVVHHMPNGCSRTIDRGVHERPKYGKHSISTVA